MSEFDQEKVAEDLVDDEPLADDEVLSEDTGTIYDGTGEAEATPHDLEDDEDGE